MCERVAVKCGGGGGGVCVCGGGWGGGGGGVGGGGGARTLASLPLLLDCRWRVKESLESRAAAFSSVVR